MNFVILHMGEGKERYYKEAFDEYCKRMNSFGSLTSVPLKPWKTPGRELSPDEIRLALEKEAEIFEEKLSSPKLLSAGCEHFVLVGHALRIFYRNHQIVQFIRRFYHIALKRGGRNAKDEGAFLVRINDVE